MTTANPADPGGVRAVVDADRVAAALAASPLVRGLDHHQRQRVLALGDVIELSPGETVMREGELSTCVYVLLEGGAEVLVRGEDGELVEVGAVGPGDLVGEVGALLEQPRSASVVTDEPSTLLRLDGGQLAAAMAEIPPLAMAVARGLARDLSEALGDRNALQVDAAPGVVEVDGTDPASARSFLRRRSLQALAGALRRGRLATAGPHPTFVARLIVRDPDLAAWAEALHRPADAAAIPVTAHAPHWTALLQRALDHLGADLRTMRHRHTRMSWGPAPLVTSAPMRLQLTIEALRPVGDATVALVTQSRLTATDGEMIWAGDDVFSIHDVDRDTIKALKRSPAASHQPFDDDELHRLAEPLDVLWTLPEAAEVASMALSDGSGARFGRLTGNLDPAHTSERAARMVGYDRPYLQHLALVNLVVAAVTDAAGTSPSRVALTFPAPAYLGGTVGVRLVGDRVEVVDEDDAVVVAGQVVLPGLTATTTDTTDTSASTDTTATTEPATDAAAAAQDTAAPDLAMPDGAPSAADVDPMALRRHLDRRHHVLRDRVRTLIGQDGWQAPVGIDPADHRELVLSWLRQLAEEGLTSLSMPASVGGEDDITAAVAVFETLGFGDLSLLVKFGVQLGLWGGAVRHLGTADHHRTYLPATITVDLPGCFALTESGHGSDARSIRTTITHDPATDELVVHTPDENARKDYIGNAATHGRIAAVFGQLHVGGVDHGVHAVVVPLRDETDAPRPGVLISDCGHKLGLNGVDNGRLAFDHVRVPRSALLNAHGTISVDGVYRSPIESDGARFFTMLSTLVQGRIGVGLVANSATKTALAIAVRYGLVRRQFGAGDGRAETLLLDYRTHQRRLLPALATCVALDGALQDLVEAHAASGATPDDADRRQRVESSAAALKAYATWHATETIQVCREACGGAGYLAVNRFAALKADTDVFTTFEGDNTVLLQLVAKMLLGGYKAQFEDMDVGAVVRYAVGRVVDAIIPVPPSRTSDRDHLRSTAFQLQALRSREELSVTTLAHRIKRELDGGTAPAEAFLMHQREAVAAGLAHADRLVLEAAVADVERCDDPELARRMDLCRQLHGLSRIDRDRAWFLEQGLFTRGKARALTAEVDALCAELRSLAGWLVDSFAIPGGLLGDTIAAG